MSNTPYSPRQRMINMMYLVLIAMLALNVSAEILKAFYLVETSMVETAETLESRNRLLVAKFEAGMVHDPVKTKPYYEKAMRARMLSEGLIADIEQLKQELIKQTDGRETEGDWKGQLVGRDNMEKHAFTLVADAGPHKGIALKKRINQTREELMKLVETEDIKLMPALSGLAAIDGATRSWESSLFENTPLAAVVTLLQKTQNDSRNAGSEVMEYLSNKIYVDVAVVDRMEALVKAPQAVLPVGEMYEAEVIVAASNSTLKPEMYMNGSPMKVMDGKGQIRFAVTEGEHAYRGKVRVKKPNGEVEELDFNANYMGFKGTATISADAMNVFWSGVENPISVSVPGFPDENVQVQASGVSLVKTAQGKYNAKLNADGLRNGSTITAKVRMKDGTWREMGSQKFRPRRLPNPEVSLAGLPQTPTTAQIRMLQRISLNLPPDFVLQNLEYKTTKYRWVFFSTRTGQTQQGEGSSEALPADLKALLQNSKRGDMFSIFDIEIKAPDGVRKLKNGIITPVP